MRGASTNLGVRQFGMRVCLFTRAFPHAERVPRAQCSFAPWTVAVHSRGPLHRSYGKLAHPLHPAVQRSMVMSSYFACSCFRFLYTSDGWRVDLAFVEPQNDSLQTQHVCLDYLLLVGFVACWFRHLSQSTPERFVIPLEWSCHAQDKATPRE